MVGAVAAGLTTCPLCLFQNYDLKVWCKTTKTCLQSKFANTCQGNLLRTLLECQTVYPNLKTQVLKATDPNSLQIHTFMIDPSVNTFAVIVLENKYWVADSQSTQPVHFYISQESNSFLVFQLVSANNKLQSFENDVV